MTTLFTELAKTVIWFQSWCADCVWGKITVKIKGCSHVKLCAYWSIVVHNRKFVNYRKKQMKHKTEVYTFLVRIQFQKFN